MNEVQIESQHNYSVEVLSQTIHVEASSVPSANLEISARGFQAPEIRFNQFTYTLTEQDIIDKKILLEYKVNEHFFVKFQPRNAPCVIINIDFKFVKEDNTITWAGLNLDPILQEGDIVEIAYSYLYY